MKPQPSLDDTPFDCMHGLMRGYYPTLMSPHAPTEAKDAAVVVTVDMSGVLNGLMSGYYPTFDELPYPH